MAVSYNKLWKLLIDKNMKKKELGAAAGISNSLIAKLGKNENVTVEELKQLANEIFTPKNMSISVGYDSWYTKKSTLEKKCRKMRKILGGQYL